MSNIWNDGICNACGAVVEEMSSVRLGQGFDYQNRCTNCKCVNHCWHHCGDMEELDYYKHNQ